jgi:hypothetical protein
VLISKFSEKFILIGPACQRPRHLTHSTADWPPQPRVPSTILLFFCETIIEAKSPFAFFSLPSHSSYFSIALPPPIPLSTECHRRGPSIERCHRTRVPPPPRSSSASTASRRAKDWPKATGRLRLHLPSSASTWMSCSHCSPDQRPPP